MSRIFTVALAAALLAPIVPTLSLAGAQTLGDVAKKEGERRQTVKPSGKTITNRDLPTVPPPSSAPPAPAAAGTPAATANGTAAAAGDTAADSGKKPERGKEAEADKGSVKDQKYWADRMKQLRDEQARDKIFAESLQSRINALTTDFTNRDDRVQREQIAVERDTAMRELERVKKGVVDRTKAIGDLEEEARRAGVPAGWLR